MVNNTFKKKYLLKDIETFVGLPLKLKALNIIRIIVFFFNNHQCINITGKDFIAAFINFYISAQKLSFALDIMLSVLKVTFCTQDKVLINKSVNYIIKDD